MRRQLRLLSHENVLERGFAMVLDENGKAVREAAQAKMGSVLDIRLANEQHIVARVEDAATDSAAKAKSASKPKTKARPKPSGDGGQGQLL